MAADKFESSEETDWAFGDDTGSGRSPESYGP
jgi:hypothetical protein